MRFTNGWVMLMRVQDHCIRIEFETMVGVYVSRANLEAPGISPMHHFPFEVMAKRIFVSLFLFFFFVALVFLISLDFIWLFLVFCSLRMELLFGWNSNAPCGRDGCVLTIFITEYHTVSVSRYTYRETHTHTFRPLALDVNRILFL